MKIDFTQELKMYRGLPIAIDPETNEMATLKIVSIEALMVSGSDNLKAEDILRRNNLARRIWESEAEIDVSVEDIVLIKSLIPIRFKDAIIIAAPALEALG